jgi:hypothetical protein
MYRSTFSLTSPLAGGECSASHPGRFTHRKELPLTHWIGGWVDSRAGLDVMEKRKFVILPGLELRSAGMFFIISGVELLVLRPLLAFCTNPR